MLKECLQSRETQHHEDSREDHAVRQSLSLLPSKIEELHNAAATSFQQVEEIMRKTRDKLNEIRTIQNDQRTKSSHEAGNEETIRNLYNAAATGTQHAEKILRKAADKINEIRIRNDCRMQAQEASNEVSSGSWPNRARGRTNVKLHEEEEEDEDDDDDEESSSSSSSSSDSSSSSSSSSEEDRIENTRILLMKPEVFKKMLRDAAENLPLYVREAPGDKPPPLCGAIPAEPTYVAKKGDMVAALVGDERPEGNGWHLAEVVHFDPRTNEYKVADFTFQGEHYKHYTLSRSRVVPLPLMRADPKTDSHALFPKGSKVKAMYSVMYTPIFSEAVVHRPPTTDTEAYLILFKKSRYISRPTEVPQRYVISVKESEKK